MTHETTAPVQSLVDDAVNELENWADDLDGTYPGRGDGDGLRRAAELIRQQQALIAQPASTVAVPDGWKLVPVRVTPQMIEGALAAHYGVRRLRQAGGPGGVDMTVNCINYNGNQAMKRMWAGALSAAPTPPAGPWESPCTPPAQQSQLYTCIGKGGQYEKVGAAAPEQAEQQCPQCAATGYDCPDCINAAEQDAVTVPRELLAELISLDHDTRIQAERRLYVLLGGDA